MADDRFLRFTYDSDNARIELARLSKGVDQLTRARFSAALERFFQEAKRDVHVLSGALRASGKRRVNDSAYHWRGRVTFGGYTPVPRRNQKKNPNNVDYARIENFREGVREIPMRESRSKVTKTNPNPGPGRMVPDRRRIKGEYGTPHFFFDEAKIQALFTEIEQDALDWLTKRDATRKAGQARRAAKAAREGRTYTPRNSS